MAVVLLYGRQDCAYSRAAKEMLRERRVEFREVEVDRDPDKMEEMIRRAGGRTTTPQIFVDGRHVGGADDLARMADRGQLDALAHMQG